MSSQFQNFKALHQSKDLFVLPNVWNAKSAMLFQEKQFSAIGTSSAAVANSLGYDDGEKMPFSDYLFVVKRIMASIKIPLTVDIERGYGKTNNEIYNHIQQLIDLGVVGINLEDSILLHSKVELQETGLFAKTIEYIKNKLESQNAELFLNIRCDTYILNVKNKSNETIDRLKIYEAAGADGIFLPCISKDDDITQAIRNTKLPLNVMCIPGLPGFETLNTLGVKRVSVGPFFFNKTYAGINSLSDEIDTNKNFSPILS